MRKNCLVDGLDLTKTGNQEWNPIYRVGASGGRSARAIRDAVLARLKREPEYTLRL